MHELLESGKIETEEFLALSAKLNTKKNNLRKKLAEQGTQKKEGQNKFDNYKYFSEAQYKELFTRLFAECQLEHRATEISYEDIQGTEKQSFGRRVTFRHYLTDSETGFYEYADISGEGFDKGDKAGYKADTGSLKYYLANNFMVATGDDPERESPDGGKTPKKTYSNPKGAPAEPSTEEQEAERTAIASRTINKVQLDSLLLALENVGLKATSLAKKYKVADLSQINFGQWNEAMHGCEELQRIQIKEGRSPLSSKVITQEELGL